MTDSNEKAAAPETGARLVTPRSLTQPSLRPVPTSPIDSRASGRPPARFADADSKKLVVGQDITVTGNIGSCEKIHVAGRVEAELSSCREMEVGPTGTFVGEAEVDEAVVSGQVMGTLNVRNVLSIRSGGCVQGTVRYGKLEVQIGGILSGDIASRSDDHD